MEVYVCWGGILRYWEFVELFLNLCAVVDVFVFLLFGLFYEELLCLFFEESFFVMVFRFFFDVIGVGVY